MKNYLTYKLYFLRFQKVLFRSDLIFSIFVGSITFIYIVGLPKLNPSNIDWLAHGENYDMLQNFIGWSYFEKDTWRFPVGLNPNYGIELSNSIVFTDSIPLLAVVFKLFRHLLPYPFQYFGFWLLICFILQYFFAMKLLKNISQNVFAIRIAALFLYSKSFFFLELIYI